MNIIYDLLNPGGKGGFREPRGPTQPQTLVEGRIREPRGLTQPQTLVEGRIREPRGPTLPQTLVEREESENHAAKPCNLKRSENHADQPPTHSGKLNPPVNHAAKPWIREPRDLADIL